MTEGQKAKLGTLQSLKEHGGYKMFIKHIESTVDNVTETILEAMTEMKPEDTEKIRTLAIERKAYKNVLGILETLISLHSGGDLNVDVN